MKFHSILLIDPFKNLLNAYRMILEVEGYLVESVLNLEDAKSLLHQNQYSVIIIEYIYPYEITEDFIERVKDSSPEIYILMVANALIDGEAFERLIHKGVDDLIMKPYSPERILVLIRKGLKRREMILQLNEINRFYPFHPVTHQTNEFIFNRMFFKRVVQQELKRSKRHHHPISLILIKISNEQSKPDELDRFLKELLMLIKKYTRSEDVLSRNNGDIILLLPETDSIGCEALLKRLHQLVGSEPKFQRDESMQLFIKSLLFQPVNLPDQIDLIEPFLS